VVVVLVVVVVVVRSSDDVERLIVRANGNTGGKCLQQ